MSQRGGDFSDFCSVFKGKRVALVGNSANLLKTSLGEEIDQHDVVVRLNRGMLLNPAAQGDKTTVYATCHPDEDMDSDFVDKNFAPQHILWMGPDPEGADKFAESNAYLYLAPDEVHNYMGSLVDAPKPTMGCMMCSLLVRYAEPECLSLYGFDFLKSHNVIREIKHNTWRKRLARRLGLSKPMKIYVGPHAPEKEEQLIRSYEDAGRLRIAAL